MRFQVQINDDNGNTASFQTDDWKSIELLTEYVKAAAGTKGYERFANDAAIIVCDEDGNEMASTNGRAGWAFAQPKL